MGPRFAHLRHSLLSTLLVKVMLRLNKTPSWLIRAKSICMTFDVSAMIPTFNQANYFMIISIWIILELRNTKSLHVLPCNLHILNYVICSLDKWVHPIKLFSHAFKQIATNKNRILNPDLSHSMGDFDGKQTQTALKCYRIGTSLKCYPSMSYYAFESILLSITINSVSHFIYRGVKRGRHLTRENVIHWWKRKVTMKFFRMNLRIFLERIFYRT